jgi:peroxiredoxin Q/BCP
MNIFAKLKQLFLNSKPLTLLKEGQQAPLFKLEATGPSTVCLSDLLAAGKHALLVFYPMDNTPGCTIQLCSLRNDYEAFKAKGIEIIAINPGNLKSHEGFAKAQELPFPIAVDKGKTVAQAYGAIGALGITERSVFLISPNGIIKHITKGTQNNKQLLALF